MLKRVLVLVSDTASSIAARNYAFGLAKKAQTDLTGLAGIDFTHIRIRMLGRAGTSAYKRQLEQMLTKQAEDTRNKMREIFQGECRAHNIPFNWLSFEGDLADTVRLAAETYDLVITGHDTAFCGDSGEPVADMLGNLLTLSPRPVVVCAGEQHTSGETLVAYDASSSAMRAVQMFALLGLGQDRPVCVTTIDASQEVAARRAASAAAYLRSHGYAAKDNPIASRVHPADALRIEIADRSIGTLVMGAFGHNGLRNILLGSTTSALIESPPCTLFLYH